MKRISLIILLVSSFALLLLSLMIVGALGPVYAGSFYTFTLPFIIMAALCFIMSIMGTLFTVFFWLVVTFHGLLLLPFTYAMLQWPGGDDGPGMAWMCFIGTGACLSGLISFILIIMNIMQKLLKKQSN